MKKILFLFYFLILVLSLFFISCSNNSGSNSDFDPNGIATKNNATDDMFGRAGKSNKVITAPNGYGKYGWVRTDHSSGILGTWDLPSENSYYINTNLTFNTDGTYNYIDDTSDYKDIINGNYELYINNDIYNIIIWNGTRGNKLQYLVSDNYLCFSKYPFD